MLSVGLEMMSSANLNFLLPLFDYVPVSGQAQLFSGHARADLDQDRAVFI